MEEYFTRQSFALNKYQTCNDWLTGQFDINPSSKHYNKQQEFVEKLDISNEDLPGIAQAEKMKIEWDDYNNIALTHNGQVISLVLSTDYPMVMCSYQFKHGKVQLHSKKNISINYKLRKNAVFTSDLKCKFIVEEEVENDKLCFGICAGARDCDGTHDSVICSKPLAMIKYRNFADNNPAIPKRLFVGNRSRWRSIASYELYLSPSNNFLCVLVQEPGGIQALINLYRILYTVKRQNVENLELIGTHELSSCIVFTASIQFTTTEDKLLLRYSYESVEVRKKCKTLTGAVLLTNPNLSPTGVVTDGEYNILSCFCSTNVKYGDFIIIIKYISVSQIENVKYIIEILRIQESNETQRLFEFELSSVIGNENYNKMISSKFNERSVQFRNSYLGTYLFFWDDSDLQFAFFFAAACGSKKYPYGNRKGYLINVFTQSLVGIIDVNEIHEKRKMHETRERIIGCNINWSGFEIMILRMWTETKLEGSNKERLSLKVYHLQKDLSLKNIVIEYLKKAYSVSVLEQLNLPKYVESMLV